MLSHWRKNMFSQYSIRKRSTIGILFDGRIFDQIFYTILNRIQNPRPSSYVISIQKRGEKVILQKIEETNKVVTSVNSTRYDLDS
jgi:hypothetical protein